MLLHKAMWAAPLARLSAAALWSRARAGGMNRCTVWPRLHQEAVLFTAQTQAFEVAAGGCHPSMHGGKRRGAEEECRVGRKSIKQEREVRKKPREKSSKKSESSRWYKSLQKHWDEPVWGTGSIPSVVSIHWCQQTDILCGWIWSLQWGKLSSLQKYLRLVKHRLLAALWHGTVGSDSCVLMARLVTYGQCVLQSKAWFALSSQLMPSLIPGDRWA